MFGLLAFLPTIFETVTSLTGKIVDWQAKKQDAQTDRERIEADENIKSLEARRDIMIAEAGSRVNAFMRVALALPACIFLWKVVVWDKVLGLGSTDDLTGNLWNYVFVVVGFYFLHAIVTRTARIVQRT